MVIGQIRSGPDPNSHSSVFQRGKDHNSVHFQPIDPMVKSNFVHFVEMSTSAVAVSTFGMVGVVCSTSSRIVHALFVTLCP